MFTITRHRSILKKKGWLLHLELHKNKKKKRDQMWITARKDIQNILTLYTHVYTCIQEGTFRIGSGWLFESRHLWRRIEMEYVIAMVVICFLPANHEKLNGNDDIEDSTSKAHKCAHTHTLSLLQIDHFSLQQLCDSITIIRRETKHCTWIHSKFTIMEVRHTDGNIVSEHPVSWTRGC